MPRILITDGTFAASLPELTPRFPNLELVCPDDVHPLSGFVGESFDAIVTQSAHVNESLLAGVDGLRLVLKLGRSYHNIDVDAVRSRKLIFASVPRKGPNCVAELALTMILALSKDLLTSHQSVAAGAYRLRGLRPEPSSQTKMAFHWMGNALVQEVVGQTLGIVGMGEIGCELARRAAVMGMRTLYYKRSPLSPELETRFEARYRPLDALLQESRYVCLAVPHTPDTERMIGAAQLALMSPDAYLVNVGRGGLVDEEALITALREQRIRGAALDVFTYEPLQANSPLCTLDNVLLTPHIGGGTGTTRTGELADALQEVTRILAGEAPHIDLG
jgi:phosphogluconate 2-dehydrogenase